MSTTIRVVLTHSTSNIETTLEQDLRLLGVDVVIYSIDQVYSECRASPPNAVIYFSSPKVVDDAHTLVLKRIGRDWRNTMIYSVSADLGQSLNLLTNNIVEAIFPETPKAEQLLSVIQQATIMHSKKNLRATPRYPVQFRCMIKVVGAPGLVEGEVSQLGREGFMATTPTTVPPGECIRFSILSQEIPNDIRIEGDGEIRWDEPTNAGGVQFGVKFTKLNTFSEEQLLTYINKLRTNPKQSVSSAVFSSV